MPVKPSSKGDEYFARLEFERRQKVEAERHAKMKVEEKRQLKKLHQMRCPKCGMELIEINYKNLKIDECSSCRGAWLDHGELDQVAKMERGALDKFFSIFK